MYRRRWNTEIPVEDALSVVEGAVERGCLATAVAATDRYRLLSRTAQAGGALRSRMALCTAWMVEAETFEAKNGIGSLLDPNHPFNIEILPRIEQCLREMKN